MSSTLQASAVRRRLLFVALGLAGPVLPATAMTEDELRYQTVGMRLTAEEAAALEAGLAEAPDELAARATLASYYMRERTKEARAAKAPHVLWIIRHHATSPVAGLPALGLMRPLDGERYDEGRELWLEQVERHAFEPQVLGNAASYLKVSDRDLARDLLLRAKELDPANPWWPRQLGVLYWLSQQARWKADWRATAAKALRELEESLIGAGLEHRFTTLDWVARAALDAGVFDKAESYAFELLEMAAGWESHWNYGNAIHHANMVLGRVALASGNAVLAAEYLLAAGRTPGSPQLDAFGPGMALARQLLDAGERDAVLEFLELCGEFWKLDRGLLDSWTAAIRAGQTPFFGGKLAY